MATRIEAIRADLQRWFGVRNGFGVLYALAGLYYTGTIGMMYWAMLDWSTSSGCPWYVGPEELFAAAPWLTTWLCSKAVLAWTNSILLLRPRPLVGRRRVGFTVCCLLFLALDVAPALIEPHPPTPPAQERALQIVSAFMSVWWIGLTLWCLVAVWRKKIA